MGGSTSTVYVPPPAVQDNSGQIMTMEMMFREQQELMDEQRRNLDNQTEYKANEAAAENLRETLLRQAEADAEAEERKRRQEKGKRDLLYDTRRGLIGQDDIDNDTSMLLLGEGQY